jgi:hypothetical protein
MLSSLALGPCTEIYSAIKSLLRFVSIDLANLQKYLMVVFGAAVCQAFTAADVRSELGIDRDCFVALAYFLGSDYTGGVSGIGIVNAMEILQTFPMSVHAPAHSHVRQSSAESAGVMHGLLMFKNWIDGYDVHQELRDALSGNKQKAKRKAKSNSPNNGEKGTTAGVKRKSSSNSKQKPNRYKKSTPQLAPSTDNSSEDDEEDSDDDFVSTSIGKSGSQVNKKSLGPEMDEDDSGEILNDGESAPPADQAAGDALVLFQ